MTTTAVTTTEQDGQTAQLVTRMDTSLSMKQITDRVNLVHNVLEKVMKKGTHFGTVPGCGSKMVLLKPGADVLAMTFRLVPQFKVEITRLENGHREYDVTCSMYGPTGELLGQGVGSASTMEKKYRYRRDEKGAKIENEDIADVYNTVLKIAKKRAHIDATLTCTACCDLFTQDLIDDDEDGERKPIPVAPPPDIKSAAPVQPKESKQEKPESAQEQPTGILTVEGVVTHTSVKGPEDNSWKKWSVRIDGQWYGTFSESAGTVAVAAKGRAIRLGYKKEGQFNTILSVQRLPESQDAAQDGGRDKLIADIDNLISLAKPSRCDKAFSDAGLSWEDGDAWKRADAETLKKLADALQA